MASKVSRDDSRKRRELDEARKAGTAPAEQDEEGRDINPHIPQYVTKTPWYLGIEHATLSHQRQDADKVAKTTPLDEHERYKKGVNRAAPKARTFRKGACTNCGAMTHTVKSCVERPRKLGANHTKSNIAPDEHLPNLEEEINYDGKRDRWRGYNPAEYQRVVDRYAKIEEEKLKVREKQLKEETFETEGEAGAAAANDSDSSDSEGDDQDEAKYADSANMIQKFDAKNRVSVRNLRIREDTAKYLHNLDVNSAHYDPKTRTMRASPYEHTGLGGKAVPFAGDNFVRYNGDVVDIAHRQIFAWDATSKGEELHAQADPTLAEVMYKRFQDKRENFKATQQQSVLEKYGGEEHLEAPPKELLMAQSEHYVEYSKLGRVIKGQEKAIARSKYLEDQHPGNHASVWGSFWKMGQWGYACCHSHVRESYCAGEAGKSAAALSEKPFMAVESSGAAEAVEDEQPKSMVDLHREKQAADAAKAESESDSSDSDDSGDDSAARKDRRRKRKKDRKARKRKKARGEGDDEEDEDAVRRKKIREATKKQKAEEAEATELLKTDERSRKYGAIGGSAEEPTEEEMEAYRLRQGRADDPMNQFLS